MIRQLNRNVRLLPCVLGPLLVLLVNMTVNMTVNQPGRFPLPTEYYSPRLQI